MTPTPCTLSAQREHKEGERVTKGALSVFDICTNGTRGVSWKIVHPPAKKQKKHSGARLHKTTQEAGASVILTVCKQTRTWCTVET